MTTTIRAPLTGGNRVGLVLAAVLGAADLAGPSPAGVATLFFVPRYGIEPIELLVLLGFLVSAALGLATIVGVVLAWLKGNRIAARVVAGARVVSLLMTALIFLAGGQDLAAWVFVIAAAVVILDIVAIILVLSRPAASPRVAVPQGVKG